MDAQTINLAQIAATTRQQVAATLASAIVIASGRPTSIQAVVDLMTDIQFAMFPDVGSGTYQQWAKTRETRLNKVHAAVE